MKGGRQKRAEVPLLPVHRKKLSLKQGGGGGITEWARYGYKAMEGGGREESGLDGTISMVS